MQHFWAQSAQRIPFCSFHRARINGRIAMRKTEKNVSANFVEVSIKIIEKTFPKKMNKNMAISKVINSLRDG